MWSAGRGPDSGSSNEDNDSATDEEKEVSLSSSESSSCHQSGSGEDTGSDRNQAAADNDARESTQYIAGMRRTARPRYRSHDASSYTKGALTRRPVAPHAAIGARQPKSHSRGERISKQLTFLPSIKTAKEIENELQLKALQAKTSRRSSISSGLASSISRRIFEKQLNSSVDTIL